LREVSCNVRCCSGSQSYAHWGLSTIHLYLYGNLHSLSGSILLFVPMSLLFLRILIFLLRSRSCAVLYMILVMHMIIYISSIFAERTTFRNVPASSQHLQGFRRFRSKRSGFLCSIVAVIPHNGVPPLLDFNQARGSPGHKTDFHHIALSSRFSSQSRVLSPQSRVLSSRSHVLSPRSRVLSSQSRVLSSQSRVLPPRSRVLSLLSGFRTQHAHFPGIPG
jgi:hypothetical protein